MNVRLIALTRPTIPEARSAGDLLAYCARVSNPANQANLETAPRLVSYLARKAHWSPFEMVHLVVEVTTTRTIARQILRHRSFSFQEFSQRYAEVTAEPVLSEARLQDPVNRQASLVAHDSELQTWWTYAQREVAEYADEAYRQALDRGIAKEVARNVLPEGLTPSMMYVAGTARSFVHYCQLRCAEGTQPEHRSVAILIRDTLLRALPDLTELLRPEK